MKGTILVTGGSRGIGAECVRQLAAAGRRVVFSWNRSREEAEALSRETQAAAVRCDVADSAAVEAMFDAVGPVEGLVCCAGIAWRGLLTDMTDEDWHRLLAVDLDGVFYCCRRALRDMVRAKRGSIVTVASMWGQVGASCEAAYSTAKAGVIGLTKALAKEVGPSGIRVNCVSPGVILTDMNRDLLPEDLEALREETPLEQLGEPRDAANAVKWLLSEESAFVTGQVLGVNGGMVI